MLTAKEANALLKKNAIREEILVAIEKEIIDMCQLDECRLFWFVNKENEENKEWLKEKLISFGYTILPPDSEIEDSHVIIDWGTEEE